MKFAWLDINCSFAHTSLALPALHAQLSSQIRSQSEWNVVRGTIKTDYEEVISQVLDLKPEYIFATCWLFNTQYLSSLLIRIKALLPTTKIFLGGPEFLGYNKEYLQSHPFVTAIFKGEGEEMFEEFINSLINQDTKWENINGFEFLKDVEYIESSPTLVKHFNKVKAPHTSEFFNWEKPFVQLETSRGCFNTCKFCVSGIDDSKVQDLTIEQIRESLELFKEKGIKEIRILDRTFNANLERSIKILNLFNEFYPHLKFHLEIHPALISSFLLEHLKTLPKGLLHLEAGIQSLNQSVIDVSGRKGSCEKSLEGLKSLTPYFDVHADLIAGLPLYTYEMCLKDVIELMGTGVSEVQLELLKSLPGTYFRKYSKELGIVYSKEMPYEVLKTNSISYLELNKLMIASKALDFWYNDDQWREVFKLIITDWNKLEDLILYMKDNKIGEQPLSMENKVLALYEFSLKYAPQLSYYIELEWIRKGLSLKKKPAEKLVSWTPKNEMVNPFLNIETTSGNKFYYYETPENTYWFWFNPTLKRVGVYNETVIKN